MDNNPLPNTFNHANQADQQIVENMAGGYGITSKEFSAKYNSKRELYSKSHSSIIMHTSSWPILWFMPQTSWRPRLVATFHHTQWRRCTSSRHWWEIRRDAFMCLRSALFTFLSKYYQSSPQATVMHLWPMQSRLTTNFVPSDMKALPSRTSCNGLTTSIHMCSCSCRRRESS